MTEFWDCASLLEMKDADGEDPMIFIVSSRVRGPGKTFSFTKKLMTDFLADKGKFILLCRTQKETGSVAQGMFKAMLDVVYPGSSVREKIRQGGVYSDVYVDVKPDEDSDVVSKHCGYVIAINAADAIKKISSNFHDATAIYFDEFMPEQMQTYLKNEVEKFHSVYKSVARGGGSSVREVPVYMSSNTISIANPYFVQMGLTQKIQSDTKRVRGRGVVFQRATNDALAKEHEESAFEKALGGLRAGNYSDNSWLNDSGAGVGKPKDWGESMYVATLIIDGAKYGFRLYTEVGVLYMGRSYDDTHPSVFRATSEGDVTTMLLRGSYLGQLIKRYAERGAIWFQDQTCKVMAIQHLM